MSDVATSERVWYEIAEEWVMTDNDREAFSSLNLLFSSGSDGGHLMQPVPCLQILAPALTILIPDVSTNKQA